MAKAVQPQKIRFSQAIQTPLYKNLVNNTLGDPVRAGRFIANITSAVAVNAELQKCDPGTILAGALLGESLFLQPSPQLGQFYLVPFKSKAKYDREGQMIEPEKFKAQFVLGYKGYIQLALRTGQYKRLNVLEVKNGELSGWDPFEERFHEMHFIEDFEKRMSMPTIGYIAHFEYINGVSKIKYTQKCRCFCPIGKADYTNNFTVTITPKKWIPDYCEIDKFIHEQLDGKSLVIEDAACKLKQWLTGKIHPYWVEVESDVTDGVHGHVTVTV